LTPAATHRVTQVWRSSWTFQALELSLLGCRLPVGAAESRPAQWSTFLSREHERVRGGQNVALKVSLQLSDNPPRKEYGASRAFGLWRPEYEAPVGFDERLDHHHSAPQKADAPATKSCEFSESQSSIGSQEDQRPET
jgi:hypothetical protein